MEKVENELVLEISVRFEWGQRVDGLQLEHALVECALRAGAVSCWE